ncbi:MAG: hypothetical protein ACYCSX_17590 [Acidimicrobiales bacterium]
MPVPVSDEIAGALGAFFHSGSGPSHSVITGVLLRAGYSDGDDHVAGRMDNPNKEQRVQSAVRRAIRRPDRARDLTEGFMERACGHLWRDDHTDTQNAIDALLGGAQRWSKRLPGCFAPGRNRSGWR